MFLSAACIHVMSCAVCHAACVFHWLSCISCCRVLSEHVAYEQCWGKLLLKVMHYNIALLPKKNN